jgi:hypothetical protein
MIRTPFAVFYKIRLIGSGTKFAQRIGAGRGSAPNIKSTNGDGRAQKLTTADQVARWVELVSSFQLEMPKGLPLVAVERASS